MFFLLCFFFYVFTLGAYNNAGLVPLGSVIAPGVPPPPAYTPSPAGAGKPVGLPGVGAQGVLTHTSLFDL